MRLERLEVTGFGRIGERRLDLAPRLTVLLGENEAGKTTLHRAVRTALYGIDAGGPGRAVDRSDWTRWSPWGGRPYGIALTYSLAGGRRFTVTRRLEERDRGTQVLELGGRDLTDQMRIGRGVVPGRVHLGLDEAVFCATACLGEGGLRLDAPDAAARSADRLQETIERLADSASRATAAEAVARLREAEDRVGTERRGGTPLGAATAALRRLEMQLADARVRHEAIGREQDHLRELEVAAAEAERHQLECERDWLVGRIAALASQRRELAEATAEAARLAELIARWERFAEFPVEVEERVSALGGELSAARAAEREARGAWEATREGLAGVERRRSEIALSLRALGRAPRVSTDDVEEAKLLSAEVAAEGGVERRAEAVQAAEARVAALRQEIAATGLSVVPVGGGDGLAGLLEEAAGAAAGQRMAGPATGLIGLAAALAATGLTVVRSPWLLVAAGAAVVAAAGLMAVAGMHETPATRARRELARRCPGLDLSPAGIERARTRLPSLRALHADLQRQQLLAEAGNAELEEARRRITDLTGRCLIVAARIPIELPPPPASPVAQSSITGLLERARTALTAVSEAAAARRRSEELEAQDAQLLGEENAAHRLRAEAERRERERAALEEELAAHLESAGLDAEPEPARAVAAFRQACSTRRQLDATRERLVEVRRRVSSLGRDDDALDRQLETLGAQLRRRGGDVLGAAEATPLDGTALQVLEAEVELARQRAVARRREAAALRERINGVLQGLPPLSDLEDERAACTAARERALHQLAALRRARELIEETARRVHRNVAPRLAGQVASRLALVTEDRYDAVNVDADSFAVSLRGRERPDFIPLDLVSQGTRDQVSLLLRIALSEVFGAAGEPIPLLLDEPLATADPNRRRRAVDFLLRLSAGNQVLLATCDPAIAEQVARAHVDGCSVIELDAPHAGSVVNGPARRTG